MLRDPGGGKRHAPGHNCPTAAGIASVNPVVRAAAQRALESLSGAEPETESAKRAEKVI